MKYVIYALLLLLIVLHQDFWNWHRYEPLIFGFIPVGLAHHVGISLAAAVVGGLAVKYCWPAGVDVADSARAANTPERKGRA
ncbi:MAG: hypothetical protein HUU22_13320 [Phycisphaerae bacterium]|nr:hypothetical protein [Phycisphaerae bacterium]NUQ47000.1 hypothetical protein [Phycisphaerae bacterium]